MSKIGLMENIFILSSSFFTKHTSDTNLLKMYRSRYWQGRTNSAISRYYSIVSASWVAFSPNIAAKFMKHYRNMISKYHFDNIFEVLQYQVFYLLSFLALISSLNPPVLLHAMHVTFGHEIFFKYASRLRQNILPVGVFGIINFKWMDLHHWYLKIMPALQILV